MKKAFSEKIDLKLIKLVKENPVLYDTNDPKYMDFNAREVAWQKIGDELEKPAADCKVRWINIRDVHRRILRKSMCGTYRPKRPYKYSKPLEFMRPFYKEVASATMEDESDEESGDKASETWTDVVLEYDNNLDSDDDDKPIVMKRKRTSKKKKSSSFEEVEVPASTNNTTISMFDATDPVDAFLISIGTSLKKFSPYHLELAKSKIFHIVQQHDLQQIVERQPARSDNLSITNETPLYFQG